MSSLLYPAKQKLYNALSNLEKFNKNNNFFDNISSLDAFFSEFRSITFVLQKSLSHTEYIKDYEMLRDKYIKNDYCKWLKDSRDSTVHVKPFELVKEIEINIYYPHKKIHIKKQKFTISSDIEISEFLNSIKRIFCEFDDNEVFFSVEYFFYEANSSIDIYENIIFGINQIKRLLIELEMCINEKCDLCNKLNESIQKLKVHNNLRDIFLVDDYVYYPKLNEFERAQRIGIYTNNFEISMPKTLINNGFWNRIGGEKTNLFDKFVLMHIVIGTADLITTSMIIYYDETYEMDTYHSSNKTTMYRKINEISKKIIDKNIKEIYIMQTYIIIDSEFDINNTIAKERAEKSKQDILVFMKVDSNLNEEEYFFEDNHIKCENYIQNKLMEGSRKYLEYGKLNMQPIINAFKTKKQKI